MTPFYLASSTVHIGFEINLPNISGLLYIGIFASVVAYFFWNYGVSKLGPNTAGTYLHLMPLFGAGLSVIFLEEGIHAYHLIGAAFIATGLWLSNHKASISL
jgi:drug/metabolite transporter (DMT)-like permease